MLRKLAFLLSVVLPWTAHAMDMSIPPGPSSGMADFVSASQETPRRGALFRVSHDGKTGYLFGTIHVGKQNFFPLPPEVTSALANSSALVLELDVRAAAPFQKALAKYGYYPAGQTIRDHLSPAALKTLDRALARAGLSMKDIEQYRPWLVANILVGQEIEKSGFQRSNGVEGYLLQAAAREKKPLRELETADYQLSLFATLSDAQQEAYLLENIAEIYNGKALKKSAGLIEAWGTADAPRIAELAHELTTGDSVSATFMDRTLLGKRNPEMADHIGAMMDSGGTPFVGIGLLHLVGSKGVPALLKQRGYEVEQLY
ncbi:TraB/GumN family protein [Pseudoduganella sp. RAF19]|uniref:TraB/GumN family protein n=2 Tax=unclassified Pseudoduganella TaxID=2637179 RepID=UPI003F95805A